MDNRPLIGVTDAARSLGVCRATVYRLARSGAIPAVRIGKAVRLKPETVEAIRENGLPEGR